MFGFGKKKEQEKKKSTMDKLIMGAIVGGAIGSVIGMSIAPKKGKDTREFLAQKGKEAIEKGKEVTKEVADKIQTQFDEKKQENNLSEAKLAKKGFFKRLKEKLGHQPVKPSPRTLNKNDLKKIPHEQVSSGNDDGQIKI